MSIITYIYIYISIIIIRANRVIYRVGQRYKNIYIYDVGPCARARPIVVREADLIKVGLLLGSMKRL